MAPGLGKALVDFLKALDPLGRRQLRHHGPRLFDGVGRQRSPISLCLGNGPQGQFPPGFEVLAIEIAVDGQGGFPARGHRGDGDVRTGDHVAPGKDALPAGGQGVRIRLDQAPGGEFDAVRVGDKFEVGLLADGHDDDIGGSSSGLIFQIGGSEAPLLIKDPFHGPEFEAADLALPSQDLLDAPPVADLHALLLGLCHFPGGSRHLFPGFERDQGDLAPLAPGGPGHVHGHVAAADDRHFLALEIELLTRGRVFEIFDAPEDSLGVRAGHRQADGILRPDAQEDRLEAFGGEQIVDGAARPRRWGSYS